MTEDSNAKCPHCGQAWAGKHVYSRSEIEQLCKNPAEFDKHIDAINTAQKEGRIDYNH